VRRHDRHSRFGLGRGRTTLHRAFYSAFYCVCAAADQRLLSPSLSLPPSPSPLSLTLSLSLCLSLFLSSRSLCRVPSHTSVIFLAPLVSSLFSIKKAQPAGQGHGRTSSAVLTLFLSISLSLCLSLFLFHSVLSTPTLHLFYSRIVRGSSTLFAKTHAKLNFTVHGRI